MRNGDRETAEKESKSKKAGEKVAKEIPKQTEKPKKKIKKKKDMHYKEGKGEYLRDELPELITNTDFDVAIAYALKLSGCSF